MNTQPQWTIEHYRIWTAWQEHVNKAMRRPWLMRALLRPETRARFCTLYTQLRALPRRTRRVVQRTLAQSLAGVALLLALGQGEGLAATINITGSCTLVDAITSANTNTAVGGCTTGSGPDTLVLDTGSTHTLTTINNSTSGPTALPVISSEITIEGNTSTITRLSGAPDFRILAVNSSGNLTLQDTTVSGGRTSGGGGPETGSGGGILNFGGRVSLEGCTVSDNTAGGGGGIRNASGTLTLTNSTVSGNSAAVGGGVSSFRSGLSEVSTLTLTDSMVAGNTAFNDGGGLVTAGTATLTNSIVAGNTAFDGGGVVNYGTTTLINSVVSGNIADLFGGGVFNRAGTLTLTDSMVAGNTAAKRGGGILNSGATTTLTNSTVSGNKASYWGGVGSDEGTVTLTNTTVSSNKVLYGGGGWSTVLALGVAR